MKNKPIAETCQHKNDGSGVSDSSDYLPLLVTLCGYAVVNPGIIQEAGKEEKINK